MRLVAFLKIEISFYFAKLNQVICALFVAVRVCCIDSVLHVISVKKSFCQRLAVCLITKKKHKLRLKFCRASFNLFARLWYRSGRVISLEIFTHQSVKKSHPSSQVSNDLPSS